jgi:hypothetical protein
MDLNTRIAHALQEVRITILGTKVFFGFGFMFSFLPEFDALPKSSRYLGVGSLYLLLLAIGFLLLPISYHRLVERGRNSKAFHKVITNSLVLALLPFACALGIDLYITANKIMGLWVGLSFGVIGAMMALYLWYGFEAFSKEKAANNPRPGTEESGEDAMSSEKVPKLEERIKQVLVEIRIVLPGLQTLLGFQFATTFQESFSRLPENLQILHLVSLGLMAVSIMLLMSPAAYHRIVEEGYDSERLHRYSSVVIIAAMALLGLGLAADLFVVIQKVTHSTPISVSAAALIILVFYGLWFGYTLYVRGQVASPTLGG